MTSVIDINIPGDACQYTVYVGWGILSRLGEIVRERCPHDRAAVLLDASVAESLGPVAVRSLHDAGYYTIHETIQGGEQAKSLDIVSRLYQVFLKAKLDRRSPVIAIGGGAVGDTVGFAAATYLRGVPFINVPTTLLAMVDAAVGGKTAVNIEHPDDRAGFKGKNLVGAFHQPHAVLSDAAVLETLPERHLRSGLAECIKHGIIGDPHLVELIESSGGSLLDWDESVRVEFICRNVRVKAEVVEADARESRRRMVLNLGHTFAHVIEPRTELGLQHGEAVALGLIASAAAGRALSRTSEPVVERIEHAVGAAGLPTRVSDLPSNDELTQAMLSDKKTERSRIRLIIPEDFGRVEIVDDVPVEAIHAGWDYLRS